MLRDPSRKAAVEAARTAFLLGFCARQSSKGVATVDSLRHIPQVFFEFFARLLPGFAALILWLWLFGGAAGWRALLDTMVAGKLDANNAVSAAALVGVSGCYL